MKRILSSELSQYIGQEVRIRGWVHTLRCLGKLNFLIVRDCNGLIQVVIQNKETLSPIQRLQSGTVVEVHGKVVASSQANLGVEIIDPRIRIEVPVTEVPPIEYYKPEISSDLDFILDHRPIALRNQKLQAVFKIQAEITHAYRLYMHDQIRAVEYFAPNILGASSEGGAEFFHVDYFGYTATLAQSSQLYKQIMVGVNERVFALMPFFRAENSHTPRHLAEGKQFEFEMGFFDHWHEVLDVQEGAIKFIVSTLQKNCQMELAILGNPLITAPMDIPFPRITFAEAQEIYYQRTKKDERKEIDLSPAAEKELCLYAREKYGTDLIFITDWKTGKRPFYSYPKPEDPSLTNTFDLLCAGTEITSGGQRRHTYESMVEGIRSKEMDPNNFSDYLSIFLYGMPPHGGFGMGLERLTMTLLGLKNIREASLFPSDPKRIAGNRIKAKICFGAENIRNEILHLLRKNDMEFRHVTHGPSSELAALETGLPISQGIKALILRGKLSKKNFQVCLFGNRKLDMKAINEAVKEKCEFETPEIIRERYGLEVGGIPPFGNLLNIDTFFDEDIVASETVIFSCGLVQESIVMKTADLLILVQPILGSFSKLNSEVIPQ